MGLRDAVAKASQSSEERWSFARAHMGETDGYVVGLFGLDCQHGCASEIHPVYALALRARDTAKGDRWAFLERNSGSEGFCSDGRQIDLGSEYLALLLTAPRGTSSSSYDVVEVQAFRHPHDATVRWAVLPVQQGALLLVRFPRDDPRSQLVKEEVVLQWR